MSDTDTRSELQVERDTQLGQRVRRTADHDDATVGWTAQQGPAPAEITGDPAPYALEQLPNPQVAIDAGLPPQQVPTNLIGGIETPRSEGGQQGVDPYRHPNTKLPQTNVTAEEQAAAYKDLQENGPSAPGSVSSFQTPAIPTSAGGGVDKPSENRPTAQAMSSTPGSTDPGAGASETNKK